MGHHWLLLHWPDPILIVKLLWMDHSEITQSVEEWAWFQFVVNQDYTVKTISKLSIKKVLIVNTGNLSFVIAFNRKPCFQNGTNLVCSSSQKQQCAVLVVWR